MSDMRKYSTHLAVYGGFGKHHIAPTAFVTRGIADCPHRRTKPDVSHAFVDGMLTISLFPRARDVVSCLDPEPLAGDWKRVGGDIRKAMGTWSTMSPKRDREAV